MKQETQREVIEGNRKKSAEKHDITRLGAREHF